MTTYCQWIADACEPSLSKQFDCVCFNQSHSLEEEFDGLALQKKHVCRRCSGTGDVCRDLGRDLSAVRLGPDLDTIIDRLNVVLSLKNRVMTSDRGPVLRRLSSLFYYMQIHAPDICEQITHVLEFRSSAPAVSDVQLSSLLETMAM